VEIGERKQGNVVVLSPVGRIDNDTSPAFQSKLLAATAPAGRTVLVDLSRVEYVSSAGLRALMMGAKQAKANKGRLAVTELKPVVKEIFTISRFSYVVEVFATLAEALQAFAEPG
jgi:anti-sigma B factor antagonist